MHRHMVPEQGRRTVGTARAGGVKLLVGRGASLVTQLPLGSVGGDGRQCRARGGRERGAERLVSESGGGLCRPRVAGLDGGPD